VLLDNRQFQNAAAIVGSYHFYRDSSRRIFKAIADLLAGESLADLVTLRDRLEESGSPDVSVDVAYAERFMDGTIRSCNVVAYAQIVRDKAEARWTLQTCEDLAKLARNGNDPNARAEIIAKLTAIGKPRAVSAAELVASTLAGVVDPKVGEVSYLADGLLPASAFTLQGAGFKTGKTLVWYAALLDLARGAAVFGAYRVSAPVKVAVFQFEMPDREDNRRFRRLAIGAGMYPGEVPALVESGHLTVFNRPPINLADAADLGRFRDAVRRADAEIVFVDSCIAAFAGQDINDNGTVRQLVADAFGPLTSEGRAVLGMHHKRKKISGARAEDDDRHAIIGAQAWQASADRVYALERLDFAPVSLEDARQNGAFRLRLSLVGSWTPEEAVDAVLEVRDVATENGAGTSVRALTEGAQVDAGGVSPKQRAALALRKLVRLRRCISKKEAFAIVSEDEGVKERTLDGALAYAKAKRWSEQRKAEGSKSNAQELIPGADEEGVA
jgi:hypothetical protein